MRRALAPLALLLAGCLSAPPPAPVPDGGPPGGEAAPTWALADCQATLHVWLVPLAELREKVPEPFQPAVLREQGLVDTPLGRVVFYLYDCARTERDGLDAGPSLLGLLGVRVVPPQEVAPPEEQPDWAVTPWVSIYALHLVARGPVAEALNSSGLPWEAVEGEVRVQGTPLPDAPMAEAHLRLEGSPVFDAAMQGVAGQVENFSRPERYFHMPDPQGSAVRWLDVSFLSTLWETEGRVDYAPGSAWDRAVGSRAYDAPVDHHALRAALDLVPGAGVLGPGSASGAARVPPPSGAPG